MRAERAGPVVGLLVLAGLPALLGPGYAAYVVILAVLFSFVTTGLNLTFGFAGQHAFGHPVFFGVGGYAAALLAVTAQWPVPVAIPAGALIAGAISALVAYPCLRLRGIYFGVATIAFAYVIYIVAQNWVDLTRGPMGIPAIPPLDLVPPERLLGVPREAQFHVLVVAVLAVTLFLLARLVRSPTGRAWIAIRENEPLAASVGVEPARYKFGAFVLGGVIAGLGGAFYAHYVGFISPTELGFHYVIVVLIMMIAGGTSTLVGPVVGGLVFGILPEVLRVVGEARNLVLGTILLLCIAFLPEGLVGLWRKLHGWTRAEHGPAARPDAGLPRASSEAGAATAALPATLLQRAFGGGGRQRLEIRGVGKSFGGLRALDDVSFGVEPGEIVGVIGPNGAGKTTLFNVITGFQAPTAGAVLLDGRPVSGRPPAAVARSGISRTFQVTSLFLDLSVEDNVRTATHLWAERQPLPALLRTRAFREREAQIDRAVEAILGMVDLAGQREVAARALAYGDQRRLEVAIALASGCGHLLLDEPAAGLTPEESARLRDLIRALRDRGYTVTLIEHDMDLVMGLCDRIVVLSYGRKIAEGTPAEVAGDPEVVTAYLGTEAGHA